MDKFYLFGATSHVGCIAGTIDGISTSLQVAVKPRNTDSREAAAQPP